MYVALAQERRGPKGQGSAAGRVVDADQTSRVTAGISNSEVISSICFRTLMSMRLDPSRPYWMGEAAGRRVTEVRRRVAISSGGGEWCAAEWWTRGVRLGLAWLCAGLGGGEAREEERGLGGGWTGGICWSPDRTVEALERAAWQEVCGRRWDDADKERMIVSRLIETGG
uniref:Uncharacterized protein n=1 Tax=Oryza nivara TaxID=4536 RepID=A0A0E0HL62_ORYNI